MQEKNELNVYNWLEQIRKGADAIESIHAYEVNVRQHGNSKEDELRAQILELDRQILDYEIQLAQLQDVIDNKIKIIKSINEANDKLIEKNKLCEENIKSIKDQADALLSKYEKLPKAVKKLFGVN